MLDDPDSLLQAADTIEVSEVDTLGLYGVLGDYDWGASDARAAIDAAIAG